jgi:hypothetical protein
VHLSVRVQITGIHGKLKLCLACKACFFASPIFIIPMVLKLSGKVPPRFRDAVEHRWFIVIRETTRNIHGRNVLSDLDVHGGTLVLRDARIIDIGKKFPPFLATVFAP